MPELAQIHPNREMDLKILLPNDPQSDDFNPDLPALCTPHAQVLDLGLFEHEMPRFAGVQNQCWLENNGFGEVSAKLRYCGTSWLSLKCPKRHKKFLQLRCKLDFCPVCGQKGSRAHKIRAKRAKGRLLWANLLGYVIFTLPADVSASRPEEVKLRALEAKAEKILKRNFNTPGGLIRRHDMGDSPGKLHIHFNCLFPILGTNGRGKIPAETLEKLRDEWAEVINEEFSLDLETSNVYYGFETKRKKIYHKIKYVLRSTVGAVWFHTLSDKDKLYIMSLKKKHNTKWWGELRNNKYRQYLLSKGIDPDVDVNKDNYLSGYCPCGCGKFSFDGIYSKKDLPRDELRFLENDVLVCHALYAAANAPPEKTEAGNAKTKKESVCKAPSHTSHEAQGELFA
jgi:hypothetical protein